MARTARSYTIVEIQDGALQTSHYATADALKDAIAKRDTEGEFMVFEGTSVEFSVDTTPRVTLLREEGAQAAGEEGRGQEGEGAGREDERRDGQRVEKEGSRMAKKKQKAPWGYRKDGKPKKKPGRKKRSR